ncbi:MAG TPA: 4-oxalocrotonate tautomerase [Armatimonadetes bacterium]|nr:4-oxalocrotonate tautomerase [Armatimonadota bacterium]
MPLITVDGPRLAEVERKRQLVEKLTQAAVEVYGLPKEAIIVLIRENAPENVGVAGQLIADRHREA